MYVMMAYIQCLIHSFLGSTVSIVSPRYGTIGTAGSAGPRSKPGADVGSSASGVASQYGRTGMMLF